MSKTWVGLIFFAVLVAALVTWNAYQPEMTVEVFAPQRETIRAYVEEQAVTELPQDYLVSMPIAGWFEPITLREGDKVTADQVVARLETDDLEARVTQAEQRMAVLQTQIAETRDHRLEQNALVEVEATVKAVNETVQAADAKLEAARAVMDFARSELERLQGLSEAASASSRELREADMIYRKARAEFQSDVLELAALKTLAAVSYIGPKFIRDYIDRKDFTLEQRERERIEARAQLDIERRNLQRAEIRSPIDGVVLEHFQTRRQYLGAGTPLLTVGRLEDLEVVAEVLTERVTRIRVGDVVEIFGQAIPDGPVTGRVARIHPQGFKKISSLGVEQQRVSIAIGFDVPATRLGVNYRVYVRIYHAKAENALTLPRTCLFRGDSGTWQVMAVRGGKTVLVPVEVGLTNDLAAQIVSGLTEKDEVVARPSSEITPRMRVRVTQD